MNAGSMHSLVVAAALIMVLLVAGCGGDEGSGGAKLDGSLKRVQDANKLIVCSSNDVPYAYRDPKSKDLKGTDIDMLRVIAKELKVDDLELYEVPIDGILSAVNTRRCDIISDNIAITAERAEQIAFSEPMYKAGQALVVPEGNPANVQGVEDFSGHKVGSYLGTIQLQYLEDLAKKDDSIEVKSFKNIPEILAELRAGRLDAAVFDDMVASYSKKTNPSLPIEVLNYKVPIGDYTVGAGFRKEDRALRYAFNDANRKMQLSGELDRILEDWGLNPVERYQPFPNCCP
jgi:polar amino acid transport system substrate-binding protein